jgi:hypothetical protein
MRQAHITGIVFDQQNIHEPFSVHSLILHIDTVLGGLRLHENFWLFETFQVMDKKR